MCNLSLDDSIFEFSCIVLVITIPPVNSLSVMILTRWWQVQKYRVLLTLVMRAWRSFSLNTSDQDEKYMLSYVKEKNVGDLWGIMEHQGTMMQAVWPTSSAAPRDWQAWPWLWWLIGACFLTQIGFLSISQLSDMRGRISWLWLILCGT